MKIAITGHRPNKLGNDYNLTSDWIQKIKWEIQLALDPNKPDTLITGMALGIDQLFAQIAIEQNIPFIAAIPCLNQEYKWPEKSQRRYFELIENPLCTKILTSNKEYDNNCMQVRNRWMVDNAELLIAVWNGTSGGTKNCIDYAKSINREIIIINPNDYKI